MSGLFENATLSLSRLFASRQALVKMGKSDKGKVVVELFIKELWYKDGNAQLKSLEAAKVLGGIGELSVPYLVKELKSEDWMVRIRSAQSLAITGTKNQSAITALKEASKDAVPAVSDAAKKALATLGV